MTLTGGKAVPLLCLDLDWTVRFPQGGGTFINHPDDVAVFPEAVEMMRRWKRAGGRIIGVSNQGGVALGHLTAADCAAAMTRTREECGQLFDWIGWCPHHPSAQDPRMARCWCRKPSPGLIVEAALGLGRRFSGEIYPPHLGLMAGDRDEDQRCAGLAGLDFLWAQDWRAQAGEP